MTGIGTARPQLPVNAGTDRYEYFEHRCGRPRAGKYSIWALPAEGHGRAQIRFLLAASFHRFEYGLKARIISQRCETSITAKVRDAFIAAGDCELQPFKRVGVITL